MAPLWKLQHLQHEGGAPFITTVAPVAINLVTSARTPSHRPGYWWRRLDQEGLGELTVINCYRSYQDRAPCLTTQSLGRARPVRAGEKSLDTALPRTI
ncbi:hypothetical protein SBA4_2280006 [Candidatus Sulfopaludibacter sp. SbA4]|nr:hypothetical protein SBA4_2280006 [Candidatus Sulfopaludibacter sp. SbA4]